MPNNEQDQFSKIVLNLEKRLDKVREIAFKEQKEDFITFLNDKYRDDAAELIKVIRQAKNSDYIINPKHYPLTKGLLDKVKNSPTFPEAEKLIIDALNEQKEENLNRVKMYFETSQQALEMLYNQLLSFQKASERVENDNKELNNMNNELKEQLNELVLLYKEIFE